jgi:HSPB1-associated protein 1
MARAWLVQVAQLYGRKQWTLHPPGSSALQPSRVPYEESSVFSEEPGKLGGGAAAEGGAGAAEGEGKGALRVVLDPGEVLLVPRHWWHRVETLSPSSLSVNTWLEAPTDPADRVKEALVRMVACALMSADDGSTAGAGAGAGKTGAWWLNPTEEAWAHGDSIEALRAALRDAAPPGAAPPRDVETRDVVNALCTGDALDEAAAELCRRATLPSAPRALRCGGGGGGGGGRHAARAVEAERARSAVASECATMARRFCAAGALP